MKLLIASDAWLPQINGVVRTLSTTIKVLQGQGHDVEVISPDRFRTMPCPTYPEIRLAFTSRRKISNWMDAFQPDHIHIATEGPIGWAVRGYCLRNNLAFTTSFHTKFPEYVQARLGLPASWSYRLLRKFHNAASHIMVATQSIEDELIRYGFNNIKRWSRGVDVELFHPRDKSFLDLPRPLFMYVGRVAVEKNIEAFLKLNLPGSKCVVGDGPQFASLKEHYPEVHFPGMKMGEELAAYYAAADVMVFPSLTDTFGLVLLEAMACGVPVAAYPVAGPLDVVAEPKAGCLDADLEKAALRALELNPEDCRQYALGYAWEHCTRQFYENLVPARRS